MSKCNAPVEEGYAFCPWCGKQLSADRNPIPQSANAEKLTFSAEEQAFFRELLKKYFKDGKIQTKPDRIFWEESFTGWGAVDDYSWEESEFVIIEPLNTQNRAKYVKNGALSFPDREKLSVFFRTMIGNSRGCLFFEHLGPHKNGALNMHWKDTLVVANPYGIGMDVLVVHESFDDKD